MMLSTRTILGLAIDDSGMVVAEVGLRSGSPEVRHAGRLDFEGPWTAGTATEWGQKLRQFLRANHFSARRAVVGIPTKWVAAKEIVAPPAPAETLAGLLSIQAERAFSLNATDLICDYCGRTSASEQSRVLLLAARREIIGQVGELTDAAGLQVQSVTVSALAFGQALSRAGPEPRYGLYARRTYCEFWCQLNGKPRFIKHIPIVEKDAAPGDRATFLTSTIQRLILLSSQQGQSPPYPITAYDACDTSGQTVRRLHEQLTPQITVSDGRAGPPFDGTGLLDRPEETQAMAAVAVAAAGTDRPPVDFLNPRIGPKKKAHRPRVIGWAAFIGFALLVALMAVIADWRADVTTIATCSEQLEQLSDDIVAAREIVDRISYARTWTSQEPRFLECLRELTLAFPEEPSIWATSLGLSENAEGALVGKAIDEESFYEVLDQIKQNEAFADVQMIHIRDAGRDLREKEFAISFTFQGVQ